MKKYKYKILPIILLLIFAFSAQLSLAQEPTGNCNFGQFSTPGYTQTQCDYVGGSWSPAPINQGGGSSSAGSVCSANIDTLGDIICKIGELLNAIIPVLVALGVVYFLWGVVQYVIGGDEEAKKKGRSRMVYGIIGLVVIVGLWGLVTIVTNTFGIAGKTADISGVTSVTDKSAGLGLCRLETNPNFQQLVSYVICLINRSIVPLIFALAVLMFVWGVVQYVINTDEEAKKAKGKQFMIWGIIALTVMVGVWGLVGILAGTFGLDVRIIPQVSPR